MEEDEPKVVIDELVTDGVFSLYGEAVVYEGGRKITTQSPQPPLQRTATVEVKKISAKGAFSLFGNATLYK